MENIIPFFFCVLLFLAAIRWLPLFKQSGLNFAESLFFFSLKILFGFVLIAVYTKFYPQRNLADVFKYFDDACVIYHNAKTLQLNIGATFRTLIANSNPALVTHTFHFDKQGSGFFEANHHLIIYIHLLLRYLSLGNIYVHSLWFSFLSFLGSVGIYTSLKKHFSGSECILKAIVFCIPSVLFWSSGMLKETLILLSLGLIGYSYTFRKNMSDWIAVPLLLLALIVLLFIKPYVLFGVMLATFAYWLLKQEHARSLVLGITIICTTLLLFLGNDMANLLIHKRNEFITLSEHTNTQSLLQHKIRPENGLVELLNVTPSAIYAVCMEPSLVHLKTVKDLPFCLENLFLFLGLLFLLMRYPAFNRNKLAISAALIVFAWSQFMIIGWTVPVSGALVRYKVTALPFLIIGLLFHVNLLKFKYDVISILSVKN